VIVQVASSLILAIGSGLFVKNLQNLQAINYGFETKRVLFTPVELRLQGYSEARARIFYQRLTERVEALQGVQSVSLSSERPISGFMFGIRDILIEGQVPSPDGRGTPVDQSDVAPKYFDTLGIDFVRGRDFNQQDQKGNAGVVVINEAMAHWFWPGVEPIGKRLSLVQFMAPPSPLLQVVGVVKDTRFHRLDEKVQPHLYLPLAQNFEVDEILYLRTGGDPRSLIPEVRRVVKELDQELPVFEIRTLFDWIQALNRDDQMIAALIGVFGVLALVLAAVGLYGVISYMVSQREREIGVRVALGASASDVLKLVVRQGLLLTLTGVIIGLAVALALARIIAHWLYGVSATELGIFATAATLLVAVALIASYYPARKATKVDPMVVLRSE
jgi:predicted permease